MAVFQDIKVKNLKTLDELRKGLELIASDKTIPKAAAVRMSSIQRKMTKMAFEQETAPTGQAWEQLSSSRVAHRKSAHPILRDKKGRVYKAATGAKRTYTNESDDNGAHWTVQIRVDSPLATWHQFGTTGAVRRRDGQEYVYYNVRGSRQNKNTRIRVQERSASKGKLPARPFFAYLNGQEPKGAQQDISTAFTEVFTDYKNLLLQHSPASNRLSDETGVAVFDSGTSGSGTIHTTSGKTLRFGSGKSYQAYKINMKRGHQMKTAIRKEQERKQREAEEERQARYQSREAARHAEHKAAMKRGRPNNFNNPKYMTPLVKNSIAAYEKKNPGFSWATASNLHKNLLTSSIGQKEYELFKAGKRSKEQLSGFAQTILKRNEKKHAKKFERTNVEEANAKHAAKYGGSAKPKKVFTPTGNAKVDAARAKAQARSESAQRAAENRAINKRLKESNEQQMSAVVEMYKSNPEALAALKARHEQMQREAEADRQVRKQIRDKERGLS